MKRAWWICLLLAVALGAWRLRFDPEILDLLPADVPAVQGLKIYQEHFTNARELLVTVRAADAETAEQFAGTLAEKLRAETNLVAGVTWQPPWLEQPGQLAEILACLWLNQPPAAFAALTNRLSPANVGGVLADTRDALATSLSPTDLARRAFDPFNLLDLPALTNFSGLSMGQGQSLFASTNGTFRILFVQARPELAGYRECTAWLQAIRAAVGAVQTNGADVVVHYTGRPVFVAEISAQMQKDLTGSVTGTAVIIAILFWLAHRRWGPMLWLLTLLLLILAATLALGGLVLGTVNLVSLGFAAVLLGLAVDYAVVHYQEALAHPHLSVPEIRRAIAPSILWAAITTVSAFLVLNLGGLPGLAQLGTLVGTGVALAALVMVMIYLPPLFPGRRQSAVPAPPWWNYFVAPPAVSSEVAMVPAGGRGMLALTLVVMLVAGGIAGFRPPVLDHSADPLKPRHSEAQSTLEEITAEMGVSPDALWLIVSGASEQEVWKQLGSAEQILASARARKVVGDWLLPTLLWPRPECQAANRVTAGWFAPQAARLREAALGAGFNTNALLLTDELIRTWSRAAAERGTLWPTNEVSRWLLKRFVVHADGRWLVLGLVYPASGHADPAAVAGLSAQLARQQMQLSGWGLLGASTLARVQGRMWQVVTPMVLLVLLAQWLAFRRLLEVGLGMAVLLLGGLCLLAIMSLAGWSWNLLNLMAVPLLLGTGVDYGIFMQLALRRHGGDRARVQRSVGRALLLCGSTAIAGFGSLAWSSNAGMASLGKICATGIALNMLIAIFLLPSWWLRWAGMARELIQPGGNGPRARPAGLPARLSGKGRTEKTGAHFRIEPSPVPVGGSPTGTGESPVPPRSEAPSSFYRAWLWRLGLVCVRLLPAFALRLFCQVIGEIYYRVCPARRKIVERNLLPVVGHDARLARRKAHGLFLAFAGKLADLWRFESGRPMNQWLTAGTDWGILEAAYARKKGVLLLTPHLGNWELGGALLARRGLKLVVLTQAEPAPELTELRRQSRARWGIETFVVGGNGFDFVEIIRRLQEGAMVALLLDRPPEAKAVAVELFGQPFRASVAAAELARASGCALIGVTVCRQAGGYAGRVLPEFGYDRAALGNRENRRQLTQQILSAFEPEIRAHPEQWFHFVPVWRPAMK